MVVFEDDVILLAKIKRNYVPPFGYQTTETMDPKKLDFFQEIPAEEGQG